MSTLFTQVMKYAAPASGILCMELKNPTTHDEPSLSRSIIIQRLSQMVGFLEYVTPTAPNGDLCHNVKVIIHQVLDQQLNIVPPIPTAQATADPSMNMTLALDYNEFQFSGLDLLDTFDWARAEFSLD